MEEISTVVLFSRDGYWR